MSGTANQLHGAVMGEGIYLAAEMKVSAKYSMGVMRTATGAPGAGAGGVDSQWPNSRFGRSPVLVACCEVADPVNQVLMQGGTRSHTHTLTRSHAHTLKHSHAHLLQHSNTR